MAGFPAAASRCPSRVPLTLAKERRLRFLASQGHLPARPPVHPPPFSPPRLSCPPSQPASPLELPRVAGVKPAPPSAHRKSNPSRINRSPGDSACPSAPYPMQCSTRSEGWPELGARRPLAPNADLSPTPTPRYTYRFKAKRLAALQTERLAKAGKAQFGEGEGHARGAAAQSLGLKPWPGPGLWQGGGVVFGHGLRSAESFCSSGKRKSLNSSPPPPQLHGNSTVAKLKQTSSLLCKWRAVPFRGGK